MKIIHEKFSEVSKPHKISFFVRVCKIEHFSMNYLKSNTFRVHEIFFCPLCRRENRLWRGKRKTPLIFHFIQFRSVIWSNCWYKSGVCASKAPRIKPPSSPSFCKNNPAAIDSARLSRQPELCRIQRFFIEMKFPKCSRNPYQSLESLLTNLLRINCWQYRSTNSKTKDLYLRAIP